MSTYKRNDQEKTYYSDEQVAILKQTSLHAVLEAEGFNVKSTPSGNYFSPFRKDTHPSFHINEKLHAFYDHGEGVGGTVVDLVMRIKGCSFREALDYLASFHPSIEPIERPAHAQARAVSAALSDYKVLCAGLRDDVKGNDGLINMWETVGKTYGLQVTHYDKKTHPEAAIIICDEYMIPTMPNVAAQEAPVLKPIYVDIITEAYNIGIPIYFNASLAWSKIPNEQRKGARVPGGDSEWYTHSEDGKWVPCAAPELPERALVNGIAGQEARPILESLLKRTIYSKLSAKNEPSASESIAKEEGRTQSGTNITDTSISQIQRLDALKMVSPLSVHPFVFEGRRFATHVQWMAWNIANETGNRALAETFLKEDEFTLKAADEYRNSASTESVDDEKVAKWAAVGLHLAAVSNPDLRDFLLSAKEGVFLGEDGKQLDGLLSCAIDECRRLKALSVDDTGVHHSKGEIEVTRIREGVQSKVLSEYEVKGRGIHPAVLNSYCFQADYKVTRRDDSGGTIVRHYSATAFPNRSGGWALRGAQYNQNPGIKRSTGQDCTLIDQDGNFLTEEGVCPADNGRFIVSGAPSSENVVVFEGFNDFLAWQTWRDTLAPGNTDVVVLNSVVNLGRALPFILQHKAVHAYMDTDIKGRDTTEKLRQAVDEAGAKFFDDSETYAKEARYGDLNDYWLSVLEKKKDRRAKLDMCRISRDANGHVVVKAGPAPGLEEKNAAVRQTSTSKPSQSLSKK